MRQWRWWGVAGILLGVAALAWAQAYHNESRIVDYQNGLRASLIAPSSTTGSGLDATMVIGGSTATSLTATLTGSTAIQDAVGWRLTMPAVQVLVEGGTIAADACGGVKRVSAATAVATSTTNTFTAPAAANTGCHMVICNSDDTDTITLDVNANFKALGAANIALTAFDCTQVYSDGTFWYSAGSLLAN